MELIRGLSGAHRRADGCVLAIGAYDGIHLGHQALLARLHEHAARCGAAAVLLTFEPMPREYLAPADPPARLTSLRERWRILARTRLDYLWLLRFGEALRNLPAEGFAQLLARELRPRVVVVGHDFRFGRKGEATEALLEAHLFDFCGELYGREIEVEFAAKLRDEAHFGTLEALTAQMQRDAADARRILKC